MGRLDQARTRPEPGRTRKQFKIVNEPEKARTIVYKFLFNLMQNFTFKNLSLRFTAVQH